VVLYEEVVATPRIVDLGGRRSVPGAAITLPIACCQAPPTVRMRSITIMAFGNGSGAIEIIQLLHVSSRAAGADRQRVKACCTAFLRSCGPVADAIGLHSRHPG
jgi:hypothetical protein